MKKYKAVWYIPGSPETEFFSTELNNDSYDFSTNEYSYDNFDIIIATTERADWLQTLGAEGSITISQMNMGYDTIGYNITYKSISILDVTDVLLIDNEYFTIDNLSIVNGQTHAVTTRITDGSTINTAHYATPTANVSGYINGRYTPVGIIGKVYDEEDNLVRTVVIENILTNGHHIVLTVGSIISEFDKEFPIAYNQDIIENKVEMRDLLPKIFGNLVTFQDGFWEALGLLQLIQRFATIDDGRSTIINPWEVLKELIKLRNGYIQIKDGSYHVNFIPLLTAFEGALPSTSIYEFMLLHGGYENTLSGTSTKAEYKYKDKYDEEQVLNIESTIGYNCNVGEVTKVDIDLTKYIKDAGSREDREYMLRNIASLRGLVFGYLSIAVTPVHTYAIGKKYIVDEIENKDSKNFVYFVPNGVNIMALCYSANNEEVKFLLVEKIIKYPVSPSLYMIATGDSTLAMLDSNTASDFIYTSSDDLDSLYNPDFNYNYFTDNVSYIQIMRSDDYSLVQNTRIISRTTTEINISTTALTIGNIYIVEYWSGGTGNYLNNHLRMKGGII